MLFTKLASFLTIICISTGLICFSITNSKADMIDLKNAIFAGGCFWCMEHPFEELPGVVEVLSGYAGGRQENPTYEEVCSGGTGHREVIQVTYDPNKVSYSELLDVFWKQIDPTDPDGQFADRGYQYSTAIFYHTEEEKAMAEESKRKWEGSGKFDKTIVTEILKDTPFYKAEERHQNYYKNYSLQYAAYRKVSGRGDYLEKVWGKENLKKDLTPLQYKVTQKNGTEPAFKNEYWDNKTEGLYVDIVSGEPLFCSVDKFESGTGWPSFTKPVEADNITENEDVSLTAARTEVRSSKADSHLGHVFNDGAAPGGLRYCINSAALKFISKKNLKKEGYSEYLRLFE